MANLLIKNSQELGTTENRKLALLVAESGLKAINTKEAIKRNVRLDGEELKVMGEEYSLAKFKKIKVVGFGKASALAAEALEEILGPKIAEGVVVGTEDVSCQRIEIFKGSHPKPSKENLLAGQKIFEIIQNSTEEDLVIALVSGGGSALLTYGEEELKQGARLYDELLNKGKTISEMNTVRKHLSLLKGGGLAKLAYPATVIGLIFSDVPGDNFHDVASGPTYKDETTVFDAGKILEENNLKEFQLVETPKEDKYFEKVRNFVLVSNTTAVEAMFQKGTELGLRTHIVSTELYDESSASLKKMLDTKNENELILAAGEPKIKVETKEGIQGKGGRNTHLALLALQSNVMESNIVFMSLASDGRDNSDMAGAIADQLTLEKGNKLGLNPEEYLNKFDSYNFFEKTGDLINTGPTGANVSDLMILISKK